MANFNRVWAESAGTGNIDEPDVGAIESGHDTETPPRHNWENWVKHLIMQTLQDIQRNGALPYDPDVPYGQGVTTVYGGGFYLSLTGNNLGNRPDLSPNQWKAMPNNGLGTFIENIFGVRTETVELGGDFHAGESIKFVKVGDLVVVTSVGTLDHTSQANPISSEGIVPADCLPPSVGQTGSTLYNAIFINNFGTPVDAMAYIYPGGGFGLSYSDSTGTAVARTQSPGMVTLPYVLA